MSSSTGFTATDLIAWACETLAAGGYTQILGRFPDWDTPSSRLFEDPYNVVGIVVFDTCHELLDAWPDVQGSLVEVISRHVGQGEGKSWDGYLVLMTPGFGRFEDAKIEAVRYNTTRLRKLIATGDSLREPTDVERLLRPILPLTQEQAKPSQQSSLDLLPRLLSEQGIPQETTQLLVEAFRDQSALLEKLHQKRGER